jgi:hypothetical protein
VTDAGDEARRLIDQDAKGQICLISVCTLQSALRSFAEAAVAEEREACAGIAMLDRPGWFGSCKICTDIAAAIRARSSK